MSDEAGNLRESVIQSVRAWERHLYEQAIAQADSYDRLRNKYRSGRPLSSTEAVLFAQLTSTAAYIHLIPSLDTLSEPTILRAISFFRHLTYLAAIGAIKQQTLQGDKLMLGSSASVSDTFALYYDIDLHNVRAVGEYDPSFIPSREDQNKASLFSNSGAMDITERNGVIITVDSNEAAFRQAVPKSQSLRIPTTIIAGDAREVLERTIPIVHPTPFDLVCAIRFAPEMVGQTGGQARSFAQTMFQKTKQAGQMFFTVGSGDNSQAKEQRSDLMKSIATSPLLQRNSLHIVNRHIPSLKDWFVGANMDIQTLVTNSPVRRI